MQITLDTQHAEIHPTYLCNLSCVGCNRMCFLKPSVPDMTVEDLVEFFRQAKELNWNPIIRFVGGEPTLHPDFFEMLDLSRRFTGDTQRIQLWSNGYGSRVQDILEKVKADKLAAIMKFTQKREGSITHDLTAFCLAPADYGDTRPPCGLHAAGNNCGICVDSQGYAVCPCGGAIAGYLKKDFMTRVLADLFNEQWAKKHVRSMCQWCGAYLGYKYKGRKQNVKLCGIEMSKSWAEAAHQYGA